MFYVNDYFKDCVSDIIDLIPEEWENTSFHNDLLPSFECHNYRIWIAHHKPAKRDYELGFSTRFSVERINQHKEPIFWNGDFDIHLEDLQDVIELVSKPHNAKELDDLILFNVSWVAGYGNAPSKNLTLAEMQNPSQGWNLGERFISALRDSEIGEKNIYSAMGEQIEFIKIENSNV